MTRFLSVVCITLLCACGIEAPSPSAPETTESAGNALRGTPRVDSVSPLEAVAGVLTTFTVTGKNLGGLEFRLTDCADVQPVSGGSSRSRAFTCTPSSSPGQKAGALVVPSNGSLAFSFNVVITTACFQPVFSGHFAPSGNSVSELDSLFQAQNPIVSIVADSSTLTLTSRNGETGSLTLSGATITGTVFAGEGSGLNAFRVMTPTDLGISSVGAYQPLRFTQVALSSPFEGFQFLDPIFLGTSWATSITGSGNTLIISDAFGATGTLTLNCAE